MSESTRVMTPRFRASYAYVWEPRQADEDSEPRYGVSMLFPKTTDISKLKRAALNAAKKKWGNKAEAMLKQGKLKMPFRDGDVDRDDDPNYQNMVFINANAKRKPGIVDQNVQTIIDEDEFYSGCWARATVNFFAFDVKGNRGVGVGLNNIQKLSDGDRLDSFTNAEDDFEPVEIPRELKKDFNDDDDEEELF